MKGKWYNYYRISIQKGQKIRLIKGTMVIDRKTGKDCDYLWILEPVKG